MNNPGFEEKKVEVANKEKVLNISFDEFLAMFELLYNIIINNPDMPRHTVVWIKGLAAKLGFSMGPITPSSSTQTLAEIEPKKEEELKPTIIDNVPEKNLDPLNILSEEARNKLFGNLSNLKKKQNE